MIASKEGEEFTGFGDLVSGIRTQATSNNDTVLSGFIDLASAPNAVVLGGTYATASGYQADVIGGFQRLGDWEQFSGRGGSFENKAAGNDYGDPRRQTTRSNHPMRAHAIAQEPGRLVKTQWRAGLGLCKAVRTRGSAAGRSERRRSLQGRSRNSVDSQTPRNPDRGLQPLWPAVGICGDPETPYVAVMRDGGASEGGSQSAAAVVRCDEHLRDLCVVADPQYLGESDRSALLKVREDCLSRQRRWRAGLRGIALGRLRGGLRRAHCSRSSCTSL